MRIIIRKACEHDRLFSYRTSFSLFAVFLALALVAANTGCAGVTSASSSSHESETVSVSISPANATIQTGTSQQFTATVSGSSNSSVTWSATGGTVSTAGLYTAPSATGTYTVTAKSVADTTKTASATVTVSAAVTQLLSASPTSLSFGNILLGNTSSLSVRLSNTGSGTVTVSSANFAGSAFKLSGLSLPTTIAAGASKSATIVFTPDVSGPFSGSVSFVSNATNSPVSVSLTGTGVAPIQHSVDLSWVGSASSGVVGYYIYRSTNPGSGYVRLNTSPAPTTTYTDSTVTSGLTYYYVVTAVDGSGDESSYSNQSVATIPIP